MIFLVVKGEIVGRVLLVKANTREEVTERLSLKDGEKIVGSLTNNEINALDTTSFAVISA